MRRLVIFSLTLIFVSLASPLTKACTCTDYGTPICATYQDADAVFIGKIEKITSATDENAAVSSQGVNSISWINAGLIAVHFKVEKAFKGIEGSNVTALTYKGTTCDLDVKKGERWIVYADKDTKSNTLSFGACSGNSNLGDEDAEYIGNVQEIASGTSPSMILGKISDANDKGLLGIPVLVEGNGTYMSTVTKAEGYFEDGWFRFRVPSPGKYKVTALIPFAAGLFLYNPDNLFETSPTEQETPITYYAQVLPGMCSYQNMSVYKRDLKATAEIGGKYQTSSVDSISGLRHGLCQYKETEDETLKSCGSAWPVSEDGSFNFRGYREGKYVIVVNEKNFPEFDTPYMRHYFPGTRNFSEAQVINLEQGQIIKDLKFVLPPKMTTQKVTGKLLWDKNLPLTETSVDGDGVYFQFYDANKRNSYSLSMSHFVSPLETTEDGLSLDKDGQFSFNAFTGMSYIVKFSMTTPKGKQYSKEIEIRVDSDLKPLTVVLEKDPKKR